MVLKIIQDAVTWNKHLRWQKRSWRWILTLMLCLVMILLFLVVWSTAASSTKPTSELLGCYTITILLTASFIILCLRGRAWCVLTGTWRLDDLKSFSCGHTVSLLCDRWCIVRGGYLEVTLILKGCLLCYFAAYIHFFLDLERSQLVFLIQGGVAWRKNKSFCLYALPSQLIYSPPSLFFPIKGFILTQPRCRFVA